MTSWLPNLAFDKYGHLQTPKKEDFLKVKSGRFLILPSVIQAAILGSAHSVPLERRLLWGRWNKALGPVNKGGEPFICQEPSGYL